jgi:site-specific DNA-cytosine methylase
METNKLMNILELFCGNGSFSKVAEERGHKVITIDIDKKFNPTICMDILNFKISDLNGFKPDVVWASPPCIQYSHAKRQGIRDIEGANKIVLKTIEIIRDLKPKFWIIENPQTGLLKNQEFMKDIPYSDVSYCKYGFPYRK